MAQEEEKKKKKKKKSKQKKVDPPSSESEGSSKRGPRPRQSSFGIPSQSRTLLGGSDGVQFRSRRASLSSFDGYAKIQSVDTKAGKRLLQEMELLFPEGQVTAILGPSGAGKSTLLNILTNSLPANVSGVADSKFDCDGW